MITPAKVKIEFLFLILFYYTLAVSSCTTTENTSNIKNSSQLFVINPWTRLPTSFYRNKTPKKNNIQIPIGISDVSRVKKNFTVVRAGPSSDYEIKDHILKANDEVIIFDRIGVWVKIIDLRTGNKGWIHNKRISKPKKNKRSINISSIKMPTIFAIHDINQIYSYPNMSILTVHIPKGTHFIALKHMKRRTLVWIQETNSLAWIEKADAQ